MAVYPTFVIGLINVQVYILEASLSPYFVAKIYIANQSVFQSDSN